METIYDEAHRRLVRALRAARKSRGLTQTQAAGRLGKPQQIISQIESGNRRIDVVELAQLCTLYAIDMLELLAGLEFQRAVRPAPRPASSTRRSQKRS